MLPLFTYGGHHVRVRRTELRDKAKKLREQAMVSANTCRRIREQKASKEEKTKTVEGCLRALGHGRGCSLMSLCEKESWKVGDVQQSLVSWEPKAGT